MIHTPAAKLTSEKFESVENPNYHPLDIATLFYTRSIISLRWSTDGKYIFFDTNITGRYNIWRVPSEGGWPTQLTVSDERNFLEDPSPDGTYLLYAQDYQGNEKPNLFLLDLGTYKARNITRTENVGYRDMRWSPDGKSLVFAAERESPGAYPIWQLEPETENVKKIVTNQAGDCEFIEYSPDGKKLAYSTTRNYQYSGVSVKDLESGGETIIAPIDEKSTTAVQGWTRDSKKIYVTSNANDQGTDAVALVELKEGSAFQWLTLQEWETQLVDVSPTEDKFAYAVNEAGNLKLILRGLNGDEEEIPPAQGMVRTARFSRDGKRLAIIRAQGDSPPDIWVYDIKARTLTQVTSSLVGGLNQENFVNPQRIVYPSYDDTPITGFIYVPANIKPDHTHPAIVYPHGGPQWEHFNDWYPRLQYFASQGYVIIAPNFRGSTGFGREFVESLRKDCGGGDLRDVLSSVEFLKKTGYVDPNRIAVMGGSWGGYLTLMAMTKAPEVWAAGVSIVPLANWFTAHENEDPVLQRNDEWLMGDPIADRELWHDRSPIFFADRIKSPLLLLAGKNDIRCPAEETLQMAEAARKNGVEVEVKIYENEGHAFVRKENEIDSIRLAAEFLDKHVRSLKSS
ncbi:MAG TPA: S9 family peptidase [Candidatus Bathyarchaeia archaeon]|nr:S9 family peptidase [Candidatus Bathyarchaeia archaeon]